MKAKELLNDGSELQYKVRTVSDLIRYIKTREADSETPNYNLFFGAGCSVTSGIRPASELIDEWVNDLYERFKFEQPKTTKEAKLYFENNQSSWYNRENAYSSLFEKTYEFASQRRRFVEREVDKALPSIGYAYLVSLVGGKYFNTVFTTNFDDLINEAFYQFSNDRPLLCAHDSSIKSISLTSKRPKIIKLHGDYLFDDIKSTLRETESLEQNTKEKLIEFCKEFGLVVVGYAGNDRSIMDVIDFLTKQENFLKNGVYWCLRKDDEINHALQNLFWREKVYPVIIDGFDELFAELHTKLTGKGLDFEVNMKNSKLQKIKKRILNENSPLNSNKYIGNDIKNIKESSSKQEISEFLTSLTSSGGSKGISLTDLRNLLEVEDLLKRTDYDKAYKLAEDFYYHAEDIRDKSRYISKLISISDKKDDSRSCLSWCDKLVELDPNNYSYIIKKSYYLYDMTAKYSYLHDNSKKYSFIYKLYNASALAGYNLLRNDPLNADVDEDELIVSLNKSLDLNPSLSNAAWFTKFNILKRLKINCSNTDVEEKKSIVVRINEHVEKASRINERSLISLTLRIKKAVMDEDFDESKKIIRELYRLLDEIDYSNKARVNECLDNLFESFCGYQKIVSHSELSEKFYEKHLLDKNIKGNASLLLGKSRYFLSSKNQLSKVRSYFLSALEYSDIIMYFRTAVFIDNCLNNSYSEKLSELLESNKTEILERYYYEYKYDLSLYDKDSTHSLEYLERAYSAGMPMEEYYSNLSYSYVLSKNYQKLIDLESSNREVLDEIKSETFTINYQYAAKELKDRKFDPVCLRNITAQCKELSTRLAAFAVLGQDTDVRRLLTEQLEISYSRYYSFKRWPIISNDILNEFIKEEQLKKKIG